MSGARQRRALTLKKARLTGCADTGLQRKRVMAKGERLLRQALNQRRRQRAIGEPVDDHRRAGARKRLTRRFKRRIIRKGKAARQGERGQPARRCADQLSGVDITARRRLGITRNRETRQRLSLSAQSAPSYQASAAWLSFSVMRSRST